MAKLQSEIIKEEQKPWYEKTNKGFIRGVNWFIDNIANPYLKRTDALRPHWIKYLVHVALVAGLCTIPLLAVLLCCLACRKKVDKNKEDASDTKDQQKYEDLNFESNNDRLPNQMYDEEINRPISQDQVQIEVLSVRNQQS